MIPVDSVDTIAAIASPPGPSPRGILRLSGRKAIEIAETRFRETLPGPSRDRAWRSEGMLRVEGLRPEVPASLVVWPNARSYTGEPLVEIHTVGSPPILQAILSDCLRGGARLAEPGEFTLRAFLSGRIDLTRAEAVLAVIDSRDSAQLEVALAQLAGGIAQPIRGLRDRLLGVLAHLEANLDFAEEPDVDLLAREKLLADLQKASRELQSLATRLRALDRSEDRPRVVLVGPPNAGKSQLFNSLVGSDRAIVSPIAGTTRDYLSARIDCEGMIVELVDTAGTDEAHDAIERQSQFFSDEQAARADLILDCLPADTHAKGREDGAGARRSIRVITKADLGLRDDPHAVRTAAVTGEGLAELRSAIRRSLLSSTNEGGAVVETSVRCRDSLVQAGEALQSAAYALQRDLGDELVAVDLRQALNELGRVVGEVVTDDILDQIFSRFCIGK